MRLYELIDFEPKQSKHGALDNKNRILNKTQSKFIGGGSFGTAYDTQSNKRLNQVTKVGRTGGIMTSKPAKKVEEDGWLAYMKAVHDAQQRGDNNPYFPRMDDLKIRKDADGNLTYTANLHKLLPFRTEKLTSNKELMTAIYRHMFGPGPDPQNPVEEMLTDIQYFSRAHDPQLKDALALIESIINNSGDNDLIQDIHQGNIMWRLTGTMPQLVIVDPIA